MKNSLDVLVHVVVVDLDQSARNSLIKVVKISLQLYASLPLDIDIQVSVEIAMDRLVLPLP